MPYGQTHTEVAWVPLPRISRASPLGLLVPSYLSQLCPLLPLSHIEYLPSVYAREKERDNLPPQAEADQSHPHPAPPIDAHPRYERQACAHRQHRAAKHLHPHIRLVHPSSATCVRIAVRLQRQDHAGNGRAGEDAWRHGGHEHPCPGADARRVGCDLRDARGGDGGVGR